MLRPGHLVILVAACLLAIGVVMVHSAAMKLGGETTLTGLLTGRVPALALAAFVCLLIGTRVPVERWGEARPAFNPAPWILIVALLLLLAVYVPGLGREVNGATRWLQLGPLSFQPSEVVKWGLPFAIAAYACWTGPRMREFLRGFALPLIVVSLFCGLIAKNDLGTAVLIMVVAVAMLVVAGARIIYPILVAPVLAIAAAGLVLTSRYRVNRIEAFLDPYKDREGIGYHIIQSMAAINGGSLSGRGLGNSVQKFGYLPESTTDFIYAIICEELGVVGAAAVVLLYIGLLIAGVAIIRGAGRTPDSAAPPRDFARLFAFGVLLTVAVQAAINLSVVTGLAPTKGIALPLVSHGGTGWLLTAFCLGLLVSIDRVTARLSPDEEDFEASVPSEPDDRRLARGAFGQSTANA
ncbi:MAG: FtsW/RodA/SpoVE family cell cycle protein [Phycisphaeraceae bacterium]|nr:FtsW/RodA/SpoVE family cell cycle protein [Phycisphaeraceae bacterium]